MSRSSRNIGSGITIISGSDHALGEFLDIISSDYAGSSHDEQGEGFLVEWSSLFGFAQNQIGIKKSQFKKNGKIIELVKKFLSEKGIIKTKFTVLYRKEGKEEILEKEIDFLNGFGGADIPDLQVLKSAAGFYIGDLYYDKEMGGYFPNSRDSQYYWETREEAEDALRTMDYEVKF